MKNKIAIFIPIYPPHFWRGYNLLKSFKKHGFDKQADLFFLFTDEIESAKFGKYEHKIILPEKYRIFENHGIVVIKKFFGLMYLKDNYDYIIQLDSESLFIKNANLSNVCKNFFRKKVLYGNTVIYNESVDIAINTILKRCQSYFTNPQIEELKKIDKLYLWFNQLFIYKTSHLEEFFRILNLEKNIYNFIYQDFEYYLYMYYLILYHNFKVEDLDVYAIVGMLESYDFIPKPRSTMYKEFSPYLCNPKIYNKINNKNVFVYIQLNADVFDKSQPKKLINTTRLRKFIALFVPVKKWRRKIRGKK